VASFDLKEDEKKKFNEMAKVIISAGDLL